MQSMVTVFKLIPQLISTACQGLHGIRLALVNSLKFPLFKLILLLFAKYSNTFRNNDSEKLQHNETLVSKFHLHSLHGAESLPDLPT